MYFLVYYSIPHLGSSETFLIEIILINLFSDQWFILFPSSCSFSTFYLYNYSSFVLVTLTIDWSNRVGHLWNSFYYVSVWCISGCLLIKYSVCLWFFFVPCQKKSRRELVVYYFFLISTESFSHSNNPYLYF